MDDLDKIEINDEEELEDLQDKLLEEDFRDREKPMPVEGKSVFELQRLKKKKDDTHRNDT